MKKTITTAAAIMAALMLISCQMSSGDSDDYKTDNSNKEQSSDPVSSGTDASTDGNEADNGSGKTDDLNETDNEDEDETEPEEKILDISSTRQYSMNVGETVILPYEFGDYEVYYQVQSGDDVIEVSSKGLTALSVGTAVLKALDWNDGTRTWSCTVTVKAEGFNGSAVEYKLCGSWSREGGSSLILNSDKTGTMKNYLNGNLVQDWTFNWSGSEGGGYKFLNITNCYDNQNNKTVDDKQFTVSRVSVTSLSLEGNLGFGMPSTTSWTKGE